MSVKKIYVVLLLMLLPWATELVAQNSDDSYVQVTTLDRKKVVGKRVSENDQTIVIETVEGVRQEMNKTDIKAILPIEKNDIHRGKYWYPDVNATRYVVGSSAIPLKKGNGYAQSFRTGWLYATVGLNNHLSIGGGTELFEAIDGDGLGWLYANLRYSGKLGNKLFGGIEIIGIGDNVKFRTFRSTPNHIVTAGRGLLTYATNRFQVTTSVGYGMTRRQYYARRVFSERYTKIDYVPFEDLMYALNMRFRITKVISVVSENNVLPWKYRYQTYTTYGQITSSRLISALGFNFSGKHISAGLGAIGSGIPSEYGFEINPYVDLVYKFGK